MASDATAQGSSTTGEAGDSQGATTGTQQSGGTGSGQSQRPSRNGRSGGRAQSRLSRGSAVEKKKSNFKGNTDGMNGHVFQTFQESGDPQQFVKTLEALAEYSAKNQKHPGDLATLFKTLDAPVLSLPDELSEDDAASRLKSALWQKEVDAYYSKTGYLMGNLKGLHAVTWGQCSEAMKAKVMTLDGYNDSDSTSDVSWLLKAIRGVTYGFEGQRYIFLAFDDALTDFYSYRQSPDESLSDYLQTFRTKLDILKHYGGGNSMGQETALLKAVRDQHPRLSQTATSSFASNRAQAVAFLKRADSRRYGSLLADLENQFSRGNDQYPTDLSGAYSLLVGYKAPVPIKPKDKTNGQKERPKTNGDRGTGGSSTDVGMTFAQAAALVPGTDGATHPSIQCYRCSSHGHYASSCPIPGNTDSGPTAGVQLLQANTPTPDPATTGVSDFSFTQTCFHEIPDSWILLDSQSTVSIFRNPKYLHNIRVATSTMTVHTNGGTQESRLVGDVRNFGPVWFNPKSLANILSLAAVRKLCRVTMDTSVEPALCVHRHDGSILKFQDSCREGSFHPREIAGADVAVVLYRKIGRPSQKSFQSILQNNLIINCPVTVQDAKRALQIYGPDVATLKGKTTKGPSIHVPSVTVSPIPSDILAHHGDVTICGDIFYVQGVPFFHTISRKIQFRTVATLPNRQRATLLRETQAIINHYQMRGFRVTGFHSDGEFECIRNDILPTTLNVTAADDHVGEVERSIRTIKERTRSTIHGLPYRRLPTLLIKEVVKHAVKNLNLFPAKDGVSKTLSPRSIVTGLANPDYNKMKLEFGSYVQVFEDNNPSPGSNSTATRMTGAIALNPTGNEQGDYHFMSLTTGARLSRRQWTVLPITSEVIRTVEAMAATQGQTRIQGGTMKYEWRPNIVIEDDEDADDNDVDHAAPDDNDDDDTEDDNDPLTFDTPDHSGHDLDSDDEDSDEDTDDAPHKADEAIQDTDTGVHVKDDETINEPPNVDEATETENVPDDTDDEPRDEQENPDDARHGYNLRGDRMRSYEHRYDRQINTEPADGAPGTGGVQFLQQAIHELPSDPKALRTHVFGQVFTQMTAKAGIQKHGQEAIDALFKEFAQLDDKGVFEAMDPSKLSVEEMHGALRAVNLIKEKRSGQLKGRTCADGRPQRSLYTRAETTSPTISTDALMISLMIDGLEKRDVATADVVGAYLHADMKDFVLMRLTGDAVDIICDVNPKYTPFVTVEKGRRVLYVCLLKALYGCVKSALLWYDLFVTTLKDRGFVINPYDPCVANCMINGKQCTIGWYVDDNKISHVEPAVVSEVIALIEAKFGKMTVTRGKQHSFLGMDITFNDDASVTITMKDYLREAIHDFRDDVSRPVATPAAKDLFEIDDDAAPLDNARSDLFHSIVAKLLYVSQRGRSDISPTIAFLCTRVSRSTEQDWQKLKRLLQYLNNTIDLACTIAADNLSGIMTWVDASYAVHEDMKSHTGGAISLGRGAIMCKSTKQKLNMKSSTEAELVGASDYLPNTIWACMFMEAQGYQIHHNVLAQDNESAIRLATNGRSSAGQKSRHINIRHFFVTDRMKSENLSIMHCPTESMLADFFTKPLQGRLFRKFRSVILGHEPVSVLYESSPSASDNRLSHSYQSEERVEKVHFDLTQTGISGQTKEERENVPDQTKEKRGNVPELVSGNENVRPGIQHGENSCKKKL